MGVMPEPAAKPTRWMARGRRTTKRPSGGMQASTVPTCNWVLAQVENRPPGTWRTPTSMSPLWANCAGVLQME